MRRLLRRAYRFVTRAEKKEAEKRFEALRHTRRSEGGRKAAVTRKLNKEKKLLAQQEPDTMLVNGVKVPFTYTEGREL